MIFYWASGWQFMTYIFANMPLQMQGHMQCVLYKNMETFEFSDVTCKKSSCIKIFTRLIQKFYLLFLFLWLIICINFKIKKLFMDSVLRWLFVVPKIQDDLQAVEDEPPGSELIGALNYVTGKHKFLNCKSFSFLSFLLWPAL